MYDLIRGFYGWIPKVILGLPHQCLELHHEVIRHRIKNLCTMNILCSSDLIFRIVIGIEVLLDFF